MTILRLSPLLRSNFVEKNGTFFTEMQIFYIAFEAKDGILYVEFYENARFRASLLYRYRYRMVNEIKRCYSFEKIYH